MLTMDSRLPSDAATGSLELPCRRGRLFYAPARRVSSSITTSQGATSTRRTFRARKLEQSRENAKRLFRFVTSSCSSNQVASSGLSSTSSTPIVPLDSNFPDSTIMASVEGLRYGHSRGNSLVGGPVSGMLHRPSLVENVRTASVSEAPRSPTRPTSDNVQRATLPNAMGEESFLASGNGISMSIALAEPMLFLQGFDQSDLGDRNTTMLRGTLSLRVSKSAKIKTVSLNFRGRAETEWPEGIPPKKTEFKDKESIMNHTWPFFNAQFQTAEYGSGADQVQPLKGPTTTTREIECPNGTQQPKRPSVVDAHLSAKDAKRLSLQVNQSRSFGKGDSANGSSTVAQKGYRTFTPGVYLYNFELPIDSRLPESISVDLGSVKYELEATVERAGAFRANLVGSKEVTLIRAPSEGSLEQVEPIAISRNWEDQLHYDIVISGKSFPLGAQVPIAFKLTPLAKVQCHRIKVFVTENVQYYTSNKRVHRLEPTRKIQLFEKRADGASTSAYPGSSMRITAGGGIPYDSRVAAAAGDESVPRDTLNLLGNLDGEHNVGPTEMEFNVQLPSCQTMKERDKIARLHFDTTYGGIQVHHWIKIVMRLSKPDAIDPTKRRHFEISIDSPFHILSCRATQANIALPAYTSPESATLLTEHLECGCPGAAKRRNSPSSLMPSLNHLREGNNDSSSSLNNGPQLPPPIRTDTAGLTRPQAAHIHDPNNERAPRPMHLLRAPSFNPPPFQDDDPPPPLMTPPPRYENVIDGDPRSGLADYFARLADEVGEDDEDDVMRRTRMELPLTPGGRINRSMDERRTWLPLGQAIAQ